MWTHSRRSYVKVQHSASFCYLKCKQINFRIYKFTCSLKKGYSCFIHSMSFHNHKGILFSVIWYNYELIIYNNVCSATEWHDWKSVCDEVIQFYKRYEAVLRGRFHRGISSAELRSRPSTCGACAASPSGHGQYQPPRTEPACSPEHRWLVVDAPSAATIKQ